MSITVQNVVAGSESFDAVWTLYRAHADTLGFLPRGAFEEIAAAGRLLAADADGATVGYVAWHVTRAGEAGLVHLCVDENARGTGVATALMEALFSRTKDLTCIRLSCREDYDANKVWPRFGFVCRAERTGRGADGTRLLMWERANTDGPPLLQLANAAKPRKTHVVAMDANVFFDLWRPSPHREESRGLLADWIDDIELCVTAELHNELTRRQDAGERAEARRQLHAFRSLEARPEDHAAMVQRLLGILPPPATPSDESDRRQLAHAIVKQADFFATRDRDILDHAESLKEAFGIEALRPCDVLVRIQDRDHRYAYAPVRLAGTRIERRRPTGESELLPFQRFAASEAKADWLACVRATLARPDQCTVEVIGLPGEAPRIALAVDRSDRFTLRIVFVRALASPLTPTLLRRVIAEIVQDALDRGRTLVRYDEPRDAEVDAAFRDVGFTPSESGVQRRLVRGLVPLDRLASVVEGIEASAAAEAALWPLKVIHADIPTFVIPIQPTFAKALFDVSLTDGDLFGVPERPALALENVYYSASSITIPAGARILWYVSGKVKEVRASSVCLETTAAPATDLYGRYYRLGTWSWKDVRAAAKGDPQRTLRAYRFANTETFATPQPWSALQDSLVRHTTHGNPIASPVKVPEAVFIDLYQRGMGLPDPFSPAALLLSLSPEYAAMIASGRKTVELRRRFPNVASGTEMWIYETLPTGAITGRARILDVHRGPPARLWREFGSMTGISRSAFDQYLAGCDEAAAVMVADHRPMNPVPLPLLRKLMPGFVAPQYFRYLDARELSLLTNSPSVPG